MAGQTKTKRLSVEVRDCLQFLEALATAPLAPAAFQLQPLPQKHLALRRQGCRPATAGCLGPPMHKTVWCWLKA